MAGLRKLGYRELEVMRRGLALGLVDLPFLPPPFFYPFFDRTIGAGAHDGAFVLKAGCFELGLFKELFQGTVSIYDEGFADLPEVRRPACRPDVQHAWHLYVIQLDLERLQIGRNRFIELLREENIGTSVHFIPLHQPSYYRNTFGYCPEEFPNASAVFERIASFPIYPRMTDGDAQDVIEAVRKIVERWRR